MSSLVSSLAAHLLVSTLRGRLRAGSVVAALLAAALVPSPSAAAPDSIPRLGSLDSGWNANFWDFRLDPPPGSGHGPMRTDPKYPYTSQCQNGGCFGGPDLRPPIVDTKDPILKPWAAELMQATNEEVLGGKMTIPFTAQSRCWPGGVPGQLLFLEPMYFLQTPDEVWMIWQRDHMVRRIYLTDKHSENLKPSWFGESIGHYQGDTLVVDTIGLAGGQFHYIEFIPDAAHREAPCRRAVHDQPGRQNLDRNRDAGRSGHVQRAGHTQADMAQEQRGHGGGGLRGGWRAGSLQRKSPSDPQAGKPDF